jgi:hypothetical protein
MIHTGFFEIVRNDPGIDFELFRGRIATMNK